MFIVRLVTPEEIATIMQKLISEGNTVTQVEPAVSFAFSGHGVQATAVFDPPTGNLTITIQHKPFYVTEAMIENGINDALKGATTA